MEFRVMDEAVTIEGRGLMLLLDEGDERRFTNGCRIRDVKGNVHEVERVTRQEDVTCLFIRNGDEAYFGRLFRNIFVDATLFTLLEGDA